MVLCLLECVVMVCYGVVSAGVCGDVQCVLVLCLLECVVMYSVLWCCVC